MVNDRLTAKQEGFAQSIVHDGMNQSDAYRAHYSTAGWTMESVNVAASRLAATDNVSLRITDLQTTIQAQLDVTQAQIVGELRGIAFGNVADLMSWGPGGVDLKESANLPRELTALVSEVTSTENTSAAGNTNKIVKLKVHDKQAALKEIAKLGGMYPKEDLIPVDTALGAVLRLAEGMSDAYLRGIADGRGPVIEVIPWIPEDHDETEGTVRDGS